MFYFSRLCIFYLFVIDQVCQCQCTINNTLLVLAIKNLVDFSETLKSINEMTTIREFDSIAKSAFTQSGVLFDFLADCSDRSSAIDKIVKQGLNDLVDIHLLKLIDDSKNYLKKLYFFIAKESQLVTRCKKINDKILVQKSWISYMKNVAEYKTVCNNLANVYEKKMPNILDELSSCTSDYAKQLLTRFEYDSRVWHLLNIIVLQQIGIEILALSAYKSCPNNNNNINIDFDGIASKYKIIIDAFGLLDSRVKQMAEIFNDKFMVYMKMVTHKLIALIGRHKTSEKIGIRVAKELKYKYDCADFLVLIYKYDNYSQIFDYFFDGRDNNYEYISNVNDTKRGKGFVILSRLITPTDSIRWSQDQCNQFNITINDNKQQTDSNLDSLLKRLSGIGLGQVMFKVVVKNAFDPTFAYTNVQLQYITGVTSADVSFAIGFLSNNLYGYRCDSICLGNNKNSNCDQPSLCAKENYFCEEISTNAVDHKIINLPGMNFETNFEHYSGYLLINGSKFLFYWFVESQSDPETDPLVFWYNGGPGCSSLRGLLAEHGPYFTTGNGTGLTKNPDAWNSNASVVYIESPVGVGFSFGLSNEDYLAGTTNTAQLNYDGIKAFLKLYPQFRNHDIFIAGESFAGVYIPTLTVKILDGMNEFKISLQGIAIGNGLVSETIKRQTDPIFLYSHGFVDEDAWKNFLQKCNCNISACNADVDLGIQQETYDSLYQYDIYDQCEPENEREDLLVERNNTGKQKNHKTRYIAKNCVNTNFNETGEKYLNRDDVRKALHVEDGFQSWVTCNSSLYRNWNYDIPSEMSEQIKTIVGAKIRVLLFYGDTDLSSSFLLGQKFVESLGLKKLKKKTEWKLNTRLVGYKTEYEGLTFTTIWGAGLMAPQWRPFQSHYMINQFFQNRSL